MDLKMKSLIHDVELANQNYNNAESNYINIATYELLAAEEKLNLYIKEEKQCRD